MPNITWLADVLRAAGCTVREESGWQSAGRPTGGFDPIGVLWHHTAATSSASNPAPSLTVVKEGRSDLPGPLCHALIDYNGVFRIVAAGRANHAGESGGSGPIPAGDGNELLVGWEIDYQGVNQRITAAQYAAAVKGTAAVLRRLGRSAEYARGHRETSTTGKIDPGFVDLPTMRRDVAAEMSGGGSSPGNQWFIKTSQVSSGKIEIHNASRSSNYTQGLTGAFPTRFAAANGPLGRWQIVNNDLWFVKTSQVSSGKVEIHNASRASDYTGGVTGSLPTRFTAANGPLGTWQIVNGDLWFVKTGQVSSGKIEIHNASRASDYTAGVTGSLPTRFVAADGPRGTWQIVGGDLWFIKTRDTSSGKIEIHNASRSSDYTAGVTGSFATRFAVANGPLGTWRIVNGDLWFIKTSQVSSGKIEIHNASRASNYTAGVTGAFPTRFVAADGGRGTWQIE